MTHITVFCFSPFSENTYVIAHENKDCWIIDPGCYSEHERQTLVGFIEKNNLNPIKLINTHCHLDHIFGNDFLRKKYNITLGIHPSELIVLQRAPQIAEMFGVKMDIQADPDYFIKEGEKLILVDTDFEVVFTPGHSPGSISFINHAEKYAIVGDVLFQGSIGRTDLPGGDYDTLMQSIINQLMVLDDDYVVYNGHGPKTTIGEERRHNPFVIQYLKYGK